MSGRSWSIAAALLVLLLAAPAADAALVRVTGTAAKRALVPTAGTVRAYAGRIMTVECEQLAAVSDAGAGHDGTRRINRRTRFALRGTDDLCRVTVDRAGESAHQWVGVSADGAAHLKRVAAAMRVYSLATALPLAFGGPLPTGDELVARFPRLYRVALATPEATVPPGATGVWTNGERRVRVVTALADGTQLYYDFDAATNVTGTNVFSEIAEGLVDE
jgi:hypothetical protein